MASKKELERRIGDLETTVLRSGILDTFYWEGCWEQPGKVLGDVARSVMDLRLRASTHAICPACDDMCERRKMVEWPGSECPPEGRGYRGQSILPERGKFYCYSCHAKIVKAHGKEGE